MENTSSGVKAFAFRLKPKDDLKKSILAFAEENTLQAGSIVTCVGSLEQLHIRLANQQNGELKKGFFEIVSLSGTFSNSYGHIHISVSDSMGNATGGHLLNDTLIYTTAEIVVLDLVNLEFKGEPDRTYGFKELVVENRKTR
jgi:predicted DNA-binding protein with PD1-like motif